MTRWRCSAMGLLVAMALGVSLVSPARAEEGPKGLAGRAQVVTPVDDARSGLRTQLAERQAQASHMLCPDEDK